MDLGPTEIAVQPKVTISEEDVPQPRRVKWGHMTQIRGSVEDDRVRIKRQKRMHSFRSGMSDRGPPHLLFSQPLNEALEVYQALDALFDGGQLEVDGNEDEVSVDRNVLEELVGVAKGKIEADTDKWGHDTGYDVEEFAQTINQAEKALGEVDDGK